jgi:alkanesulfonate monooxygenase SsuD/methylene tetrahydromethanopterin reductase-like flavin-dependent oxidoreductase (luciferase family)
VRHALSLPPFGALSDPVALVDIAVAAEEHGWDGVFLWDHLLRPVEQATRIADPWIMMTALAMRTHRIRIGPMVTPIARRRPLKLAREIATLDLVSQGRLILGLGLGVDSGGELSRTGEELDTKVRGAMLDEGVRILDQLLRGEHVVHRGAHYAIDGITLAPTGVQQPRVPFWLATRGDKLAPVRRAARYEGLCPTVITPGRLAELVEVVREQRGSLDGFDIAVMTTPDHAVAEYEQHGATWAVHEMQPHHTVDEIMRTVEGTFT